ncbi:hypothetical protein T484DRAFT_2025394 [Baffinella frigidus]|nr:hypothetical protein T484DRAFT_2025394 [Cryptophyta sp. CCMP2293]
MGSASTSLSVKCPAGSPSLLPSSTCIRALSATRRSAADASLGLADENNAPVVLDPAQAPVKVRALGLADENDARADTSGSPGLLNPAHAPAQAIGPAPSERRCSLRTLSSDSARTGDSNYEASFRCLATKVAKFQALQSNDDWIDIDQSSSLVSNLPGLTDGDWNKSYGSLSLPTFKYDFAEEVVRPPSAKRRGGADTPVASLPALARNGVLFQEIYPFRFDAVVHEPTVEARSGEPPKHSILERLAKSLSSVSRPRMSGGGRLLMLNAASFTGSWSQEHGDNSWA